MPTSILYYIKVDIVNVLSIIGGGVSAKKDSIFLVIFFKKVGKRLDKRHRLWYTL